MSGGSLMRVPLDGGLPQTIAQVANMVSAVWAPNDLIIYSAWVGGLFKVSARGGTPKPLTTLDDANHETGHRVSHVFANGTTALATVDYRDRPSHIDLVDVETGERRPLIEGRNGILSQGALVFAREDAIFTAPFDESRQEITGDAARRLGNVAADGKTYFVVANDGSLAYVPRAASGQRLVWADRDGTTRQLDEEQRAFVHPRVSPDGTRVSVQIAGGPQGTEFWVYDIARGTRTRLSVSGTMSRPVWTADGKRITFQKDGSLYTMPADDSSEPALLLVRPIPAAQLFPLAWSRDGQRLLYSRPTPKTNRDVMVFSPDGRTAPLLATPRDERAAMFSPDSRWIVYAVQEPGREEEVYVQEYPGPGKRIIVSRGGGVEPVWSPRGDEIFYRSIDGTRMMAVQVRTQPVFEIGSPRLLFEGAFSPFSGSYWSNYDVTPDAQRFVMIEAVEGQRSRINVALQWVREVQARETTSAAAQ